MEDFGSEKGVESEVLPVVEEEAAVEPDVKSDSEAKAADKPEKESKSGGGIGGRIKNWIIILMLLTVLFFAGAFFLWKSGISDLKGDGAYLIVVQEKGVAKAGSIYVLATEETDIINVEELPAVTDLGRFYRDARSERLIDRLIVIRVETITELSTEPYLEYRGKNIPIEDVGGYITGALWDSDLAGEDPPWMFRANLLSEWVDLHSDKISNANYGSTAYGIISRDYRSGDIQIYPRNAALIILKYIPLEQIFL